MSARHPAPFLGILLAAAAAFGCGGSDEAPREEEAGPDTLRYRMILVERETDGCSRPEGSCAEVILRYPEIEPGPSSKAAAPAAAAPARRWVEARRVGFAAPDLSSPEVAPPDARLPEPPSPEAWAEGFLDAFLARAEEFPQARGGWFVERSISVVRNDARVVALELDESLHTGGAHPGFATLFLNLDARTGRAVAAVDELLRPDAAPALLALAEARLREDRDVPPGTPLSEAGFWEDSLPLPATFLAGHEGLLLHYDPYEIAPWALGPSSLLLPWDEVAPLLREPGRWLPVGVR